MRTVPCALLALVGWALLSGFRLPVVKPLAEAPAPAPEVTSARYPRADVVLMEQAGDLRFQDPRDPRAGHRHTYRMRYKVLTRRGREFADVRVDIGVGESLESVSARSIAPNGEVQALTNAGVALVADVRPSEYIFTGYGEARLEVPGVDVGDVVEVAYTIRGDRGATVRQWRFDRPGVLVLASRFSVEVPAGWTVEGRMQREGGVERFPAQVARSEAGQVHTWALHDLAPTEPVPYAPPAELVAPVLGVVVKGPGGEGVGTWEDLAAEVRGQWAQLTPLDPDALENLQVDLRPGDPADAYRWVRDQIRYAAVYQGLGGYLPHPPGEVLEQGWGDCKDKAWLLIQLLARQGVTAHVALVSPLARDLSEQVPRLSAFYHAVAALPDGAGGYTYLDPTMTTVAFKELPPSVAGRQMLVLDPAGARLLRVPRPVEVRREITWRIEGGEGHLEARLTGYQAVAWRGLLGAPAGQLAEAARGFAADPDGLEIEQVSLQTEPDGAVRVTARFDPAALWISAGDHRVLGLGRLIMSAGEHRVRRGRKAQIWFGDTWSRVERVVYRPSGQGTITRIPAPRAWSGAGLAVTVAVAERPDEVEFTRTVSVEADHLEASDEAALATFADHVFTSAAEAIHVAPAVAQVVAP